jgi:hypothetical protein
MNPDVLIRDEGTVWICTARFKNGTMIMGKVLLKPRCYASNLPKKPATPTL